MNTIKRRIGLGLLIIPLLLVSCSKESINYNVNVYEDGTGVPVENIVVQLKKMKPARFWSNRVVEKYVSQTDSNGNAVFKIEDFESDIYSYNIEVNCFETKEPVDGFYYSKYDTTISSEELVNDLKVWLWKYNSYPSQEQ